MARTESKRETMKASDVRQHWSKVLNAVFREKKRIIVEKSGIPVGAIISEQDLARLEALDRQRDGEQALLAKMRSAFAGVPEDELLENSVRIVRELRDQKQGTGSTRDA